MYNFIDYEFCLMTDCKTDISGFSTSMIYGLVSQFLICSVCTDVSAVVTCCKKNHNGQLPSSAFHDKFVAEKSRDCVVELQ